MAEAGEIQFANELPGFDTQSRRMGIFGGHATFARPSCYNYGCPLECVTTVVSSGARGP